MGPWLLAVLTAALSATMTPVSGDCDSDRVLQCNNKIVESSSLKEVCRSVEDSLNCVNDKLGSCPAVVQAMYQDTLANVTLLINYYGCTVLSTADADCDLDKVSQCKDKLVASRNLQVVCKSTDDVKKCLIQETRYCPDFLKAIFKNSTDQLDQIRRENGCAVLSTADADCDLDKVLQCKDKLVASRNLQVVCRSTDEVVKCLAEKTRYCPDSIQTNFQSAVDQIDKLRRDNGCSGATVVISSLALCLQLSGVAFFLSSFT